MVSVRDLVLACRGLNLRQLNAMLVPLFGAGGGDRIDRAVREGGAEYLGLLS